MSDEICGDLASPPSSFFQGPHYSGGGDYCWCGRQERNHYSRLTDPDPAPLYCRKRSPKTFVAMPPAFQDPNVRAAWEVLMASMGHNPVWPAFSGASDHMGQLSASFLEWRGPYS